MVNYSQIIRLFNKVYMSNIFYQIDAFSDELFSGNPAAVCPLDKWIPDNIMLQLAKENNLSDTVFFVPTAEGYQIRWFTPNCEVKLCGHATLAAAYVLWEFLDEKRAIIQFQSLGGMLYVTKEEGWIKLDFPQNIPIKCAKPQYLEEGLDRRVYHTYKADDYIVLLENEEEVRKIDPFFEDLIKIPIRGIIVTAPGDDCDFVSRFFAPASGINEDPVTGSAHTQLIPFWAARLGKLKMNAKQVSARGGVLKCELAGNRVYISGKAKFYMKGEYRIN